MEKESGRERVVNVFVGKGLREEGRHGGQEGGSGGDGGSVSAGWREGGLWWEREFVRWREGRKGRSGGENLRC